jgi:hypothetical protein
MKHLLTFVLVLVLVLPTRAETQVPDNVWRTVATKIDVGSEINVRLRNGQRFRATLVEARDQSVWLQPRTRVPVPVQEVSYSDILLLERRAKGSGMGAAKAAAIGVASGVGAFFAVAAILVAAIGD